MSDITVILSDVEDGKPGSADRLLNLVYDELRRLAAEKLTREKSGQTLQATALVHEAWLRLVDVEYVQNWESRWHFFGAAAEAMRRILVDKARKKNRQKHGANWQRISIQWNEVSNSNEDEFIETLDEALNRFKRVDATACQLVQLRFFTGLSLRDAADALGIAPRTADRTWAYAKSWLLREIQRDHGIT